MENSLVVARVWRVEEVVIRWGCKEDTEDPGGEYVTNERNGKSYSESFCIISYNFMWIK